MLLNSFLIQFIKSINKTLEPDKCYIMHIPRLANEIIRRMNDYKNYDQVEHKNRLFHVLLKKYFHYSFMQILTITLS